MSPVTLEALMSEYQAQKKLNYTVRFRNVLSDLPDFCQLYFRASEPTTSVLTRYGYAVDLRSFFRFLTSGAIPSFSGKTPQAITLDDLKLLRSLDIELYLEHISMYPALVDTPKLHEKAIIRLDANEVADLLDTTEQGIGMTKNQRYYHDATKVRDVAILSLFLGTGIRISELVGLDLNDIDFTNNQFVVTRKGGNQEVLAFGPEVQNALLAYLGERRQIIPLAGSEDAFFLSMQKRRITPRAVENLVKKYAQLSTPLKKITPHKLRSTYGTMLYQESGDIYLVADVLGHKDVNTTRKHYAAITEDKSRQAAKYIKLREEEATFLDPDDPQNA